MEDTAPWLAEMHILYNGATRCDWSSMVDRRSQWQQWLDTHANPHTLRKIMQGTPRVTNEPCFLSGVGVGVLGVPHGQGLLQLLPPLLNLLKQKDREPVSFYLVQFRHWHSATRITSCFIVEQEEVHTSHRLFLYSYLAVEITANSLLRPRLMIKLCSPLFLWVPNNICHQLQTIKM